MTALDWSPFGGNPVPGDPDRVDALGLRLHDLGVRADQQVGLAREVHDGVGVAWRGPAGTAFLPHLAALPGTLGEVGSAYRWAGEALSAYAPVLRQAQQLAVTALAKAHEAIQAQHAARVAQERERQRYADDQAHQATLAQQQAASGVVDVTYGPSPYVPSLGVTAQADAADEALQAAMRLADDARRMARAAARRCAAELDSAARFGGQPLPGLLPRHGPRPVEIDERAVEAFLRKYGRPWAEALVAILRMPPMPRIDRDTLKKLFPPEALEALSELLDGLSFGLTVAAVGAAMFGDLPMVLVLDEINEYVLGAKLVVDLLLVAEGYGEQLREVVWDLIGLATAGMGRIFEDSAEHARLLARIRKLTEDSKALARLQNEVNSTYRMLTSQFVGSGGMERIAERLRYERAVAKLNELLAEQPLVRARVLQTDPRDVVKFIERRIRAENDVEAGMRAGENAGWAQDLLRQIIALGRLDSKVSEDLAQLAKTRAEWAVRAAKLDPANARNLVNAFLGNRNSSEARRLWEEGASVWTHYPKTPAIDLGLHTVKEMHLDEHLWRFIEDHWPRLTPPAVHPVSRPSPDPSHQPAQPSPRPGPDPRHPPAAQPSAPQPTPQPTREPSPGQAEPST